MIQFCSIIFTIIMTSLYFFPIDIVTGVNSKMIMAGFGLIVFMVQLVQRKKYLGKDYLFLALFAGLVSLSGFFSMWYNDTNDTTYATYLVSMLVWLGGAYFIVELIKFVHGKASVVLVANYLIAVCTLQCIIALGVEMNSTVKSLVDSVYSGGAYYEEHNRMYGIGASLDVAGTRFSAVLCMIVCIGIAYGKVLKKEWLIFYGLSFMIIATIGNMISRTTTVGVALSLIYLLLVVLNMDKKEISKSKTRFWKWMIVILGLSIPLIVYYYRYNDVIYKNLRFAFEGFFSLVEKGEWDVHSNDMLQNMVVFPESLKTWIIGDGYFNAPHLSDPYYVGPYVGDFYKGTDIGYLRFIFYFGLIGLLMFMTFFCYAAKICIKHISSLRIMFLLILAVNFIVWFKVATDIFLVFALFLCIGKEENDEYNNNLMTDNGI